MGQRPWGRGVTGGSGNSKGVGVFGIEELNQGLGGTCSCSAFSVVIGHLWPESRVSTHSTA